MNFIEAINLIHFTNVKGVTRLSWERGKYLFQEKGRSWLSITLDEPKYMRLPYSATSRDILANDWELYEEPKSKLHTFEEAIAALKAGKSIKRKLWTTKVIERDFCDDYSIEFTIDDIEANDWILIGEKI